MPLLKGLLLPLEGFELARFVSLHVGCKAEEGEWTGQWDEVSDCSMIAVDFESFEEGVLVFTSAVIALGVEFPDVDRATGVTCDELLAIDRQGHCCDPLLVGERPLFGLCGR